MLSVARTDPRNRNKRLLTTLTTACILAISACDAGDSPFADATARLQLSVNEVTLDDGETLTLGAHLRSGSLVSRTTQLDPSVDLIWHSTAPSVASVTSGMIQAHSPGSAVITATSQSGATASVQVEVLPAAQSLALLVEEADELPVLSPYPAPIRVKVTDRNGNTMPDVAVDFTVVEGGGSIEPATVLSDSDGLASATWTLGHIAGTQTVQAKVSSRNDPLVELSVSSLPGPPQTLVIPTSSLGLQAGQLYRLSARLEDAYGNHVSEAPVQWSSSDPAVATVDAQGLVSGRVMGSAEVTAALVEGTADGGVFSATSTVNVSAGEPTEIVKDAEIPAEATAGSPLEARLIARVSDFYGNPVSGTEVIWEVTWGGGGIYPESPTTDSDGVSRAQWLLGPDEGVQIVEASLLSDLPSAAALAPGNGRGSEKNIVKFELIARKKSAGGSGSSVSFVGVSAPDTNLDIGESVALAAEVQDGSGNPLPGIDVDWSSSSPAVVKVNGNGNKANATGLSGGSSLIIASAGGETGWVTLDVEDPTASSGGDSDPDSDVVVATVALSASDTKLMVGETSTLGVQVLDASGSPILGQPVEWSSSSTNVASLNGGGYTVTATALSVGSSVISATVGGRTTSVTVSVEGTTLPPPPTQDGPFRAFPGAEGWGATALTQCRSKPLQVLTVTNTNSSGPGSLDQAVTDISNGHFTVIIFRTGGRIVAPSAGIRLNGSCVYIAGQTAPGDGVAIDGGGTTFWFRGSGGNISDIVMRHIRFRGRHGATDNNLIIAKGDRIVLDHLSFSWTDNYLLALLRYEAGYSAPISNVSIQNSLLSEVFAVHPTAFVLGSQSSMKDFPSIGMSNISIQRNLMAHNSHRNPMTAADNVLIANNVIYNWSIGVGMMNRRGTADWINNYAKPGPMTRSEYSYVVNPYCNELGGNFSIYASGNLGPMNSDPSGDNWTDPSRQVTCYRHSGSYTGEPVTSAWRRNVQQAWKGAAVPVQLLTANTALGRVLGDVGANGRVNCEGRWTSAQDSVDSRVIAQAQSGTGTAEPPVSEHAVGGWPNYSRGAPCSDADNDGLPDAWETSFFGCQACADPGEVGASGYLLIEHYVNGTNP